MKSGVRGGLVSQSDSWSVSQWIGQSVSGLVS